MSHVANRRDPSWRVSFLILALWLPATLFFGGHTGWWNDDYYMCGRDPAGGGAEWWVQTAPTPFEPRMAFPLWRPIAYGLTSPLITACWERPWIAHAVSALVHLGTVLLFARFMRELGVRWRARLLGALVLLCHPAAFEGVQWATVLCVPLSMAFLMGAGVLYVRHLRGELSRGGAAAMIALFVLVFLAYEQTFACAAALPIIALVVEQRVRNQRVDVGEAPRHQRDGISRRAWHALWPLAIAAVLLVIYLIIIAKTLPPGVHGSQTSLAPLEHIPRRWAHMVNELRRQLAFKFTGKSALASGWLAVREHPGRALWMAALILAGAIALARSWVRGGMPDAARANESRRALLVLLVGSAWIVLAMLPIAAVSFALLRPRMVYAALPGVGLVVAGVAEALRGPMSRAGTRFAIGRLLLGVVAFVLALAGVVCLVGTQRGYRLRQLADDASIAALRAAIPHPPAGAVFLPLWVDHSVSTVGAAELNVYYAAPWYWSYSFPTFIQHAYRRRDVFAAYCDYGRPVVIDADERGFTFDGPMHPDAPADANGKHRFAWDQTVPMGVGPRGEVVLYSPLTIQRGGWGGADPRVRDTIEVRPALVEALRGRERVRIEPFTFKTP